MQSCKDCWNGVEQYLYDLCVIFEVSHSFWKPPQWLCFKFLICRCLCRRFHASHLNCTKELREPENAEGEDVFFILFKWRNWWLFWHCQNFGAKMRFHLANGDLYILESFTSFQDVFCMISFLFFFYFPLLCPSLPLLSPIAMFLPFPFFCVPLSPPPSHSLFFYFSILPDYLLTW